MSCSLRWGHGSTDTTCAEAHSGDINYESTRARGGSTCSLTTPVCTFLQELCSTLRLRDRTNTTDSVTSRRKTWIQQTVRSDIGTTYRHECQNQSHGCLFCITRNARPRSRTRNCIQNQSNQNYIDRHNYQCTINALNILQHQDVTSTEVLCKTIFLMAMVRQSLVSKTLLFLLDYEHHSKMWID